MGEESRVEERRRGREFYYLALERPGDVGCVGIE